MELIKKVLGTYNLRPASLNKNFTCQEIDFYIELLAKPKEIFIHNDKKDSKIQSVLVSQNLSLDLVKN